MLPLLFDPAQLATGTVLLLGAHSDDIEIGCGGTLLRLTEQFPNAHYHWVVFSAAGQRAQEATTSAKSFLGSVSHEVRAENFRDGFFPYQGAEIKEYFEELKRTLNPALIFTHYREDRHQDHRVLSDLTWSTFRDHLILEYEIPKYDGDLGIPNFFVHLNQTIRDQKINFLLQHFATQANKHWFSEETFSALMALRGIESRAPQRYAEAFYVRKLIV